MGFVVEPPDRGFLDGSVHAFDLTIGPRVLGLGQTMVDVGEGTGIFEGMRSERLLAFDHVPDLGGAPSGAAGIREVGAVVGQHGVDLVGDCLEEGLQELGGDARGGFGVQLGKGKLGGPVDGDEEVEPASEVWTSTMSMWK